LIAIAEITTEWRKKIAVMGEDWKTRRGKSEKEICRVGQVDAATIYAAKVSQYSGLTLTL
jgi:hypothetical protein